MHALAVIYVLRAVEGVAEFKFIQHTVRDVEVMIVPGHRWWEGAEAQVTGGLAARLGGDVRVAIRLVDAIPAEASGKYRYVVSHVTAPAGVAMEEAVAECRPARRKEPKPTTMHLTDLIVLPFRYKPWRPRHLGLIASDLVPARRRYEQPHVDHLCAAIDWLCRAQDIRNAEGDAGGVSAGWSFEDGWLPSYPETSGYIVETFIAAAKVLARPQLIDRGRAASSTGNCPSSIRTGRSLGILASAAASRSYSTPARSCTACWQDTANWGAPNVWNLRSGRVVGWRATRVPTAAGERSSTTASRIPTTRAGLGRCLPRP